MKIACWAQEKGGAGKTQGAKDTAETLASQGYNVDLMDLDFSVNTSANYNVYESENNVQHIFDGSKKEVKFYEVRPNLRLFPGSVNLEKLNIDMQSRTNKELQLYMWLIDNQELFTTTDYLIIDTHNDFSTITQNAIAVADVVFSPIEPSKNGILAKVNSDTRINKFKSDLVDPMTRETYIKAKVYYYLTKIKHNTKSSRQLVQDAEGQEDIVAIIPHREIFNSSIFEEKSMMELKEDPRYQTTDFRSFFKELEDIIGLFKQLIDQA